MLLLKLLLVPSLIGIVTLLGRRFGAAIAGLIAGFPIVAGPILLLVAIEQGIAFAADTAVGALAATIANVFFCLAYAWTATRHPWWACLMTGFTAFAAVAALLTVVPLSVYWLFALALICILGATRLFPRNVDPRPLAPPPAIELPARLLASALLVLAVTYFASTLGSRMSGIFSAPPLLASVLAGFSHPVSGAGFAIRLLQGMVSGFYALATFCFALAMLLPRLGTGLGFTIALALSVSAGAFMAWYRRAARA